MRAPGSRTFSFISGVFLGMLSAFGLIFLILNDFNPLNVLEREQSGTHGDTLVDMTQAPKDKKKKTDKSSEPGKTAENPAVADTVFVANSDTAKDGFSVSGIDEIVIRRDELLETKNIEPVILTNPKKNKTDSLIKNFQGAQEPLSTSFKLEFWKSPVNYKGFKLIRNSLVMFGLNPDENSTVYINDDQVYLKHGGNAYKVFATEKFEPFDRINDEALLKQLR